MFKILMIEVVFNVCTVFLACKGAENFNDLKILAAEAEQQKMTQIEVECKETKKKVLFSIKLPTTLVYLIEERNSWALYCPSKNCKAIIKSTVSLDNAVNALYTHCFNMCCQNQFKLFIKNNKCSCKKTFSEWRTLKQHWATQHTTFTS